MPETFQAFFSYAHADAELDPGLFDAFSDKLAKRVSARLPDANLEIWRDSRKLTTGDLWDDQIKAELEKSHLLIVMLSPNWLKSTYCRKEFEVFTEREKAQNWKERVIPLLVHGVAEDKKSYPLDQRRALDLLLARQFKPTLADDYLRQREQQTNALVADVAADIKKKIQLWRSGGETSTGRSVRPSLFDISRIDRYAPEKLIGREAETKILGDAWAKARSAEQNRPRVLTFVALGGEGKTSLVAKWAAELAYKGWPGCEAAFAWSFYSQGTREQMAASSDLFLKTALTFFGDAATAASAQSGFDKGKRLAQLVGEKRVLLILDGLEPLQYAPTAPTPGELKDEGLKALLKGLAQNSQGLCIVTTRYSIADLRAFRRAPRQRSRSSASRKKPAWRCCARSA